MDAARLPSKCPHWYLVMQRVALNAGAGENGRQGPFSRKPSNLSSDYCAYYQQFEIALLPKWMGEPGDVEAFAGRELSPDWWQRKGALDLLPKLPRN